MRPKLIVFTGLPGAGKSAVAEAVGNKLNIPVFAKDWLEAPILRRGVAPGEQLGAIGYDLLTTLARRQLALDQSVILDSVASTSTIRSTWKALADSYDVDWLVVECVCSDEDTHRARMADRQRAIPDWPELEWSDVERVRSYYEPWDEERLVLDSVDALADNIDRALDYVNGIHVRLATPDDAPIVRYIMLLAYAEYEGALPVDSGAHAETVADVAAAIRAGGAVLASIDGVFAGSARFVPEDGHLYVGRVAVLPAHRRRGLASAMMRFLEDVAVSHGRSVLQVGVRHSLPSNVELYKSLGYEIVADQAHPRGPDRFWTMAKRLDV